MSVAKVVELLAEGSSIEKAVQSAVDTACKSLRKVKHVYITDFQVMVADNKVTKYRVNAKVTFVVEEGDLG